MKKLLSIILACAMIMSLFCVVPASATIKSTTGLYAFEDFEDGKSSVTCSASNGSLEVVDTDNGSAKALQYTFSNDVQYPDLGIPSATGLQTGFTEAMTLRGTVRYKLGTELASGVLTLLTGIKGDKNYFSEWKIPNLTDTTNWYTAEFEIPDFKSAGDSSIFNLRVGGSSEKATQSANGEDVVIYLDDLQITRELPTNKEIIEFSNDRISDYTDDKKYNIYFNTGSKAIVADPFDSSNNVLKVTPAANDGNYNLIQIQDKTNKVTYKVGDTITVTCDILVTGMKEDNLHNLQFRCHFKDDTSTNIAASAYLAKGYSKNNTGEWQTLTWSQVVTSLGSGQYMPYFYLTDTKDTDGDGKKDMGDYTYYFDNWTVEVSDRSAYIVPSVSELTATMADGVVTPSYTYAETAVTGVEAGTNASLLKVKKANGAVVASAVAGEPLVVPEAYRSESLTLEVTPVSSTGTFGDVVTAAIEAASAIEGTTLTATAADGATVVSADAIENATLIWVAYDSNGKMLSHATAACNVAAGGTVTVAIPQTFNATGAAKVKVMLWQDMTKCLPLAALVQY